MWPFRNRARPADPYWDYLSCEQFINSQGFTSEERAVVQHGLAAFAGQKLHPEIAEDTFGVFSASALGKYALAVAREANNDPKAFATSISALRKAQSIYPHPELLICLSDIFVSANRNSDAEIARRDAKLLSSVRKVKDTDQILVTELASYF
jgi:hypothetical protein